MTIPSLQKGRDVIKSYAKDLPDTAGVYRMLDKNTEVLYVGKAKALKKRVISYSRTDGLSTRIQRMVAQTETMEFVHTHTEAEALLLESNLIKKLKPRYNILLRDDKSFPYILMTGDHDFPQVTKHRGAKSRKGQYYGPFASAGLVNRTIAALQRAFMLRNCTDSVFKSRTRPCLQYHIKRCTAPCVGYVSKEEYAEQLVEVKEFLSGKSKALQERLAGKMQKASEDMQYEQAALYRDRIRAMTSIQSRQDINIDGVQDADVIALFQKEGRTCIQAFFFRGGQNFGNRAYFPRHSEEDNDDAIMAVFLAQFYENKPVPPDIIVSHMPEDQTLLEEAFALKSERKVTILKPQRGGKRRAIEFALKNAQTALARHTLEKAQETQNLQGVAELFSMDEPPTRIEVYDNSHISGTNMVGAMIVAGEGGLQKNAYRKFNIKKATASDDYGMMREVMERRFKRALKEQEDSSYKREGSGWPDLLLIDGGLGQYNAVREVLEEFGILDELTLVSIAKGEDRNAGRETFFTATRKDFTLPINDPVLHYLQRLRDEAHRFAIGAHRAKRQKAMISSPLDEIAGVGSARKKALLLHFGSAKAVAEAGVADLQNVEGISQSVAQKIYDHFH